MYLHYPQDGKHINMQCYLFYPLPHTYTILIKLSIRCTTSSWWPSDIGSCVISIQFQGTYICIIDFSAFPCMLKPILTCHRHVFALATTSLRAKHWRGCGLRRWLKPGVQCCQSCIFHKDIMAWPWHANTTWHTVPNLTTQCHIFVIHKSWK